MSTPAVSETQVSRAATLMGRNHTVRIISELDDNGPIPQGAMSAVFSPFILYPVHNVLRALCTRGLVTFDKQNEHRLTLTEAGRALGDVFDSLARWARAHQYPAEHADFATRVRSALALLRDPRTVSLVAAPGSDLGPRSADELDLAVRAGLVAPTADGRGWSLTDAGRGLREPLALVAQWAHANAELVRRSGPGRPAMRTLPVPAVTRATTAGPVKRS
ncbi:hypothetical protein ACQPZG_31880 [Streptomyces sp. CA-294286]|uniref:hypothetical protein n=1 Tax=Streptomyces sp. CA-294286 TaxID=3240070 RepID=UPI003D921A54